MTPLADLRAAVEAAAADLRGGDNAGPALSATRPRAPARDARQPTLERPPRAELGDYSTNAAMLLAPALKRSPRDVAGDLSALLRERLGGAVEKVDIAGPGFLNLFLHDSWYLAALQRMLEAERFGAVATDAPESVIVEFVSANPTGPLTAAGGRHAAFGDAVARLLELRGHHVEREYYVNDHGMQVRKLGLSVQARARGEAPPEDGYQGGYVDEVAQRIEDPLGRDADAVAQDAVALMLEQIGASLERFRVRFDTWSSERALHTSGAVEEAFEQLRGHGHVYESEGALWLRTTTFGDDKDRPLRKSDGETTYFASDIAYFLDKQHRGAARQINVWGSDHHGYIARMKAAFAALGLEPERLELLIMQFVNLVEGGAKTQMSKRRGDFVTLDDLVADIGVDAARFLMLQRSHDTMIDLDLDLAREQSEANPVYYVQYAHARIASILRRADVEPAVVAAPEPLHPSERALVKKLLAFPDECAEAADRRAPHRIATFALELGQAFAAFYRDCPVLKAPEPRLRLALCVATQRTLASALDVLGVSAPESM